MQYPDEDCNTHAQAVLIGKAHCLWAPTWNGGF